jgi:hypothetical protein
MERRLARSTFLLTYVVGAMLASSCDSRSDAPDGARVREVRTTATFNDIEKTVNKLGTKYGIDRVLLVVDIDNTLLAMNQDLGSDQWLGWQLRLHSEDPTSEYLIADEFDEMLAAQALLYALCHMHPPEASTPEVIHRLQQAGFRMLVHTSRGYQMRDATRRELHANGFDFATNALATMNCCAGPILPYQPDDIISSGLSGEEAELFLADHNERADRESASRPKAVDYRDTPNSAASNTATLTVKAVVESQSATDHAIKPPKLVSYSEGVYMTAGQHKGAMLRILLAKTQQRFDAIVFVDDHAHHVQAVQDAFQHQSLPELWTYRYTKEDVNVARFNPPDEKLVEKVTRQWKAIDMVLSNLSQEVSEQ